MHLYSASQQLIVLICLVVFLCAFTSGVTSHDPKKPICCKEDTLTLEIPTTKITQCYIFPAIGKCAAAVVFTDKNKRSSCIDPKADWLSRRMKILKKKGVICEDFTKSSTTHMGI
ncbi:C-C motif chemokine 8-like [Siphateles boraxobius]|uniref:C-C motif chemokine 8-like n=1 Tax=Siphateles boraxobius TaxID=180520 RepID=UPI004062FA1A